MERKGSVAVSFLFCKSSGFILPYLRGLEGGGGIDLSEGRDEVPGKRVRVGREADEVACSFFSFSTRDLHEQMGRCRCSDIGGVASCSCSLAAW